MAWIESHTVIIRHRKVRSLAKALRLKPVQVVGHLHVLWHAVLEQQEDGDLSSWSDDLVADAAQYTGEPAVFVTLLRQHGWLDGHLIHDWLDYAGLFLTRKYISRNRVRLCDIWKTHGRIYGDGGKARPPDPAVTGVVTTGVTDELQLLLAPNQPNQPTNQPSAENIPKGTDAGALAANFLFYRKGPRSRSEQEGAIGSFEELLRLGHSVESLQKEIDRADRMRAEPIWDFVSRLAKTKRPKTEAQIDARQAEIDAESEARRIEHENRLKSRRGGT